MCDPMTMVAMIGSIAGPLLTPTSKPPKAQIPASPAPNARSPGATVRIGTGADNDTTKTDNAVRSTFVEKRKAGNALGNLGRSGLAL